MVLLSDPQISADGSAVYYRRTWFDREADEIRGAIHRVDRDGNERAFSAGDERPLAAPRARRLGAGLRRRPRRQAAPVRAAARRRRGDAAGRELSEDRRPPWSPDGRRIAFVATAPHEPAGARAFHDAKSGARHIRMLPFKSDADGLLDGTRKHLFVIDAAGGERAPDHPRRLRRRRPGLVARRRADRVLGPGRGLRDRDRAERHLRGRRRRRRAGPAHRAATARWSRPRSRTTAARSRSSATTTATTAAGASTHELLVVAAAGGATRSLSARLERTVGDMLAGDLRSSGSVAPVWSADDGEIFVQVCDEGTIAVRAFARDGSGARIVAGGERHVYGFSLAADGALALVFSTPTVPSELALVEPYGGERRLTDANPVAGREERRRAQALPPAGRRRHACSTRWLLLPPAAQRGGAAAGARGARRPARRLRVHVLPGVPGARRRRDRGRLRQPARLAVVRPRLRRRDPGRLGRHRRRRRAAHPRRRARAGHVRHGAAGRRGRLVRRLHDARGCSATATASWPASRCAR